MTWEEIQTVKRALARLKWKVGLRRMRRYRAGHRGRLDVQRLMRTNLSHGGEMLEMVYRKRPLARPLVVLCDISGSMERCSPCSCITSMP